MLHGLYLARVLSRTPILPNFMHYSPTISAPGFEEYFDVEAFRQYEPKAVTWKEFLANFSEEYPADKRRIYCLHRSKNDCTDSTWVGMPGYYWDHVLTDLSTEELVAHAASEISRVGHDGVKLHARPGIWSGGGVYLEDYGINRIEDLRNANFFSPIEHPVLAFAYGTRFPAPMKALELHKYLQWNQAIRERANFYIKKWAPENGRFVSVHARIGSDFRRACKDSHFDTKGKRLSRGALDGFFEARSCERAIRNVSSSPSSNFFTLPSEHICTQRREEFVETVQAAIDVAKACVVHVFTDDRRSLSKYISNEMFRVPSGGKLCETIRLVMIDTERDKRNRFSTIDYRYELAIAEQATIFVGNCVSSFTAIVHRGRKKHESTTLYFGIHSKENLPSLKEREL
eukprot:g165.t1